MRPRRWPKAEAGLAIRSGLLRYAWVRVDIRTLISPLSIAPVGLEPTGRHSGDDTVLIGGGRPFTDFRGSSMAAILRRAPRF